MNNALVNVYGALSMLVFIIIQIPIVHCLHIEIQLIFVNDIVS